ncbi:MULTISPECIES: type II toxin-antitoxin system Phd/YefM family antitoxin [unclassified Caulobacter]|uniref:type II toxin-antitoxin system Phd/YefM family antitoxin n=1 Tax=unclassified Caulobacter TaxID=2648921 RepID=UPI0013050572|nr:MULTISPECIES: type II toxin-antitoxin system prevent-host-death family antitoxin [unclassified Caulobacter]
MREIDEAKAKTHFSALLKAVEQGDETIVITRNGHALAKLEPLAAAEMKTPEAARKA